MAASANEAATTNSNSVRKLKRENRRERFPPEVSMRANLSLGV